MDIYDSHNHSLFSFDSETAIEDKCKYAIDNGIQGFCLTEHFSMDDLDVSYGYMDYARYSQEIDRCREKYGNELWLGRGMEIGEPHLDKCRSQLDKAVAKMELDFIIGSVHNIGSSKLRLYLQGKSNEELYHDYFAEILAMVQKADFDVVGHLDLAKRYAFKELGNYDFAAFRDILTEILTEVIRRGKGIEINTSGWRNAVDEPHPSLEVLQLYHELGGKYITIGSDAHDTKNMASYFTQAADLLKQAGFQEYHYYVQRMPVAVKL